MYGYISQTIANQSEEQKRLRRQHISEGVKRANLRRKENVGV